MSSSPIYRSPNLEHFTVGSDYERIPIPQEKLPRRFVPDRLVSFSSHAEEKQGFSKSFRMLVRKIISFFPIRVHKKHSFDEAQMQFNSAIEQGINLGKLPFLDRVIRVDYPQILDQIGQSQTSQDDVASDEVQEETEGEEIEDQNSEHAHPKFERPQKIQKIKFKNLRYCTLPTSEDARFIIKAHYDTLDYVDFSHVTATDCGESSIYNIPKLHLNSLKAVNIANHGNLDNQIEFLRKKISMPSLRYAIMGEKALKLDDPEVYAKLKTLKIPNEHLTEEQQEGCRPFHRWCVGVREKKIPQDLAEVSENSEDQIKVLIPAILEIDSDGVETWHLGTTLHDLFEESIYPRFRKEFEKKVALEIF